MMRFIYITRLTIIAMAALALSGCRMFIDERPIVQGHSPLKAARQSPDSVAIEMIWVRVPADDAMLNEAAWQNIDESAIAPEIRRELAANGFRVGIIGGDLPDAMARVLDARSFSVSGDDAAADKSTDKLDLVHEPKVRGRRRQLRRGERWEIQASDVFASMPLLKTSGRELVGQTYYDAQAMYALRIDPQSDRSVLLELTPELHHGQPKLRFTSGEEGITRSQLRDREVFDRLRMSVRLTPGEIMVLMSLPEAGSRLGGYFHTVESTDGRQQKLILLRLAQVPQSDTFSGE